MTTLTVRLITLTAFSSMSPVLGSGSPSPPGVAGGPREVKQPPKPLTPRGAPGGVPNLNNDRFSDDHYQVAAQPGSQVTVEWVYCQYGKPELAPQQLAEKRARQGLPAGAAPPPFRPGLRPEQLDPGMTYRVTIKVVAPQVTTGPRPVGRQSR